jgi:hypothetical protein
MTPWRLEIIRENDSVVPHLLKPIFVQTLETAPFRAAHKKHRLPAILLRAGVASCTYLMPTP